VKQVLLQSGKTIVGEVPAPVPEAGQVLVRVEWSCLSPGTELAMAAATSASGMVERVRHNPMALGRAIGMLRERGFRGFAARAREKLSTPSPAGYTCSGTVLEAGAGADEFRAGDLVACAGAGYANHAELVVVPRNLLARVPRGVDLADASTVALGAIALQGVRRGQVSLGERIGVIGLGFLGQLTVQILKAAGCIVFGLDLDAARTQEAMSFGLDATPEGEEDPVNAARKFSEGHGLDAVLLTAATNSDEPLALAMQMVRRKGRVVIVGDVGLGARRELMYAKELDLVIATSYGPGRYDRLYEEEGIDYPYAYVRWTENRNMQAYLELIASGKLRLAPLIARRVPVAEADEAYRALRDERPRPYTVLLQYPQTTQPPLVRNIQVASPGPVKPGVIKLAIVGAGSFARGMHIPNLKGLPNCFRIEAVISRRGHAAMAIARQVGARLAGTDYTEVLSDPGVDAVLIATRHHLHAKMVEDALRAGKHVFVEKPLAITEEELKSLIDAVEELNGCAAGCPVVFVGFNRRYSTYAVRLREAIARRSAPINMTYRMNAGYLPADHWTHGPEGGGRAVGEACHILDLFRFLTGAQAIDVCAMGILSQRRDVPATDNFSATVRYADGSVGTLLYTAQGGKDLPKEALELHVDGKSLVLDNYRILTGFGTKLALTTKNQEKGHRQALIAFHDAIVGSLDREPLWQEAVEVTQTALEIDRHLSGRAATVKDV
jgi:predicted dehydrogenase/threonine dehydrogenase-like Zn-dependent dehydrogenase